jgi:hypothetical protein
MAPAGDEGRVVRGVTRREFVSGLGAFFLSSVVLPRTLLGTELPGDLKPLRLGFLTDIHAMAEMNAPAWMESSASLMNSLQPDLIIGGGDFVHGGFQSPGSVMDSRWKLASAFLGKLRAPLQPVIGNHDFYEPLNADGTPAPGDPRRRWKEHFGLPTTYRSFSWKGYRFLVLDSVQVIGGKERYEGRVDEAQLAWLDRELPTFPHDEPIILCTHVPFRTSLLDMAPELFGGAGKIRVLNSDRVMEKLSDRPLALILQGHVHLNERLAEKDIPCITGGAVCGKWWKGPNMGTSPGLGLIEILPAGHATAATTAWSYRDTPVPVA